MVFLAVFGWRQYRLTQSAAVVPSQPTELLLFASTNLAELAQQLDSLNVAIDKDELLWAGRVLGWRTFRSGRYELNEPHSYGALFSKLARGLQDPGRVTVLPGSDVGRLSQQLARQLRADSAAFAIQFTDSSDAAVELGLTGEELFSRMLPNTYEMYWTSAPSAVIRRLANEFNRAITQPYAGAIEESPFSLQEIVTLASIVEWEARLAEEKPRISGLYLNRLDRGMRLQADPTVLYALGERRRVLFEDYQYDHPYNTYMHDGLPPGPITNPDGASIRAVLFPEDHNYLYMVAAPDGSHVFSRTFEEHRRASDEWRRWLREQIRIRDQREREAEGTME